MKKAIPVLVALILIVIIAFTAFGKKVYDRYSYGQERADLNEYFKIYSSSDIPMILQDELTDVSARLIDGHVYLDRDVVDEYFTERFYLDKKEDLLLFSTSTGTVSTEVGSNSYVKDGETFTLDAPLCLVKNDTIYIYIDYLKKFVNFSYEVFKDPYHMQVYTKWGSKTVADIKSDTQVRKLGGVKSLILRDISAGETVEVLEVMDTWTKIKTSDAYIGYVENSRLTGDRIEEETPVTDVPAEKDMSLTRDYKINLTWHNIEYPQDGADLKAALANTKSVNVISPTNMWLIDNEGSIKQVCNSNYTDTAHNMGLEVWGLVSNFHSGTDVNLEELITYTSKRKVLVDNIVSTAVTYGMDGVNVDFESVPKSVGEDYVQFVRELAIECHKNNLVISVDHYVPTEYTAHYNRHGQAEFVDYIIIMGYDEHYAGSDVGSVSGIGWMEKGISDTVKLVPANKVINAIPFYTRVWKTKGGEVTSEAVDMEVAANFISRNGIETKLDADTSQNYGEKTMDGTLYQVWLEDTDSIAIRLNVMQAYNLAGVASWKLGQETPDVWDIIEAYMKQ